MNWEINFPKYVFQWAPCCPTGVSHISAAGLNGLNLVFTHHNMHFVNLNYLLRFITLKKQQSFRKQPE